jgi:peptide/nickel transport system substrate-binding protein
MRIAPRRRCLPAGGEAFDVSEEKRDGDDRQLGRGPKLASDGTKTRNTCRRRSGMAGRPLAIVAAVTATALLLAASGSPRVTRDGGTFRVGVLQNFFGSIDPALAGLAAQPFLRAACAGLMTTPDKPLPDGLRLVPEIAAGYPKITNGGKTYTFAVKKGVRFSNGAPVTASSFAYTINRLLNPTLSGGASVFDNILGARKVLEGKTTTAFGIVARGNTLIIRLKKPQGELLAQLAAGAGGFCVVPETVPIDPEGAGAPLPTAGPYYVSQYVPGERVVLERNRFYRGDRPHHADRFEGDLTYLGANATLALDRVESGQLDVGLVPIRGDRADQLGRKYGVNKSQFFAVNGGFALRTFVLNSGRPLFRKNPKLRQAVNFAVDRVAIRREEGPFAGYLTDQYLPPGLPGFTNARIYPLTGPDVEKARTLAQGHLRSGKAVLYTLNDPVNLAQAQILKADLKAIGLELEIKQFPQVLFALLETPGEPWDIGRIRFVAGGVPDPDVLNGIFDLSHVASPKYKRLLEAASRLPWGSERDDTYGKLDVGIARNAAPAIAMAWDNALTFVSKRTGCVVVNPNLDLAAVCLK